MSETPLALAPRKSGRRDALNARGLDRGIMCRMRKAVWRAGLGVLGGLLLSTHGLSAESRLLNVSYDVTRELYKEINVAFALDWKTKTGETITITQSHGGSSKQARSVLDGLEADVVTMNQATDLDILATAGLIAADWADRFPNGAAPYTSTIVFIVRKGNPRAIGDWSDLVKPGVQVIIPNPKTSGNGRYSYLGAWGYALKKDGNEAAARDFVTRLFKNVPVLDAGGRGATTTFAQREIGDVLLTFENEAALVSKEFGADKFEVVTPAASILAEAPVAVVEAVVTRKGTARAAEAYLEFLYSSAGQEIAARNGFRPRDASILAKYGDRFPVIKFFGIGDIAGGWAKAQQTHFAEGGIFDQISLK